MKTCSKCKELKPLSEFNKNRAKVDGHSGVCRRCQKIYKDNHYQNNKQLVYANVKRRRQEMIDRLWEYKSSRACTDCSESNPIVLEFDHLADKEFNVSEMAMKGYSWDRILTEIQKCEIVCANCHRIRTHLRGKWVRNVRITQV